MGADVLKRWGAEVLPGGGLRLGPLNGSPTIEWRVVLGHPTRSRATVRRRNVDAGEDWQTVSMREVLEQLSLDGPVAIWLRGHESLDLRPGALAGLGRAGPARLPCLR